MLDRKGTRERLLMARGAESSYNTKLRQVAKQVDVIVKGLSPGGKPDASRIVKMLGDYAELIVPWASSVAQHMIAEVSRRNARAWKQIGADMGRSLRAELAYAPTGMVYSALMDEQVALIKSLPSEAAKRVHSLTDQMLVSSERPDVLARKILETGHVTASRAALIARTEVSRTASNLTQARAMFAGSEGYIWRTSRDADVRPTHQEMEGVYVRWDTPPKTDKGLAPYHAGCGPNCRCYPDPIIPEIR